MKKIILFFLIFSTVVYAEDTPPSPTLLNQAQKFREQIIETPKKMTTSTVPTASVKTTESPSEIKELQKCVWRKNIKPDLIANLACDGGKTKICSGFVTCEGLNSKSQPYKFTKLATCSETACLKGATECRNENIGFYSKVATYIDLKSDKTFKTPEKKSGKTAQ